MGYQKHTFYRARFRRLEDRLLLNATPEATVVDLPAQDLINEDFEFAVTFDNVSPISTDVGYGPFVDVTAGPGVEIDDVTYLGTSVASQTVGTWDGSNWIDAGGNIITEHPLDASIALPAGTTEGQTWINVLAPFGSYTPDQPAIRLEFQATLSQDTETPDLGAIPGTPIDVTAIGGFQFGADALDNPSTDPPIVQTGSSAASITPVVMKLEKTLQLAEGETAQGPNFPFTYTISVDIATGIELTDIEVDDILPQNLYFLNATSNIAADTEIAPGVGATPEGIPGLDTITTAEWSFADVTGAAGDGDIVITLTAYAPETDASGDELIDPDTPQTTSATNNATVGATYDGTPVDGQTGGALQDSINVAIRPFTVLKSVSVEGGGSPTPGGYLRFSIEIDISDYQNFQSAALNDVLTDGLTFDTTDDEELEHTPVLQVRMNGEVFQIDLSDADEVTAAIQGDYTEALTFNVSQALQNAGYDGELTGDLFEGDTQEGPTRLTLVYYARIEESYREPGRGAVVDNDVLSNAVIMAADSATSGNASDTDGSQSSVTVPSPEPQKSVYAVNGVVGSPASISPGDEVTYRIRVEFSANDVNNLTITDYLPLPIYDVDGNGGAGFSFVDTQGGLPATFTIVRGPDDSLTGASNLAGLPTVTTDGAGNGFTLTFANFDETDSIGGVVDLLYTVEVTDEPLADELLLVNQALITSGSSTATVARRDEFIGEVVLRQPVLQLTKGAVATDAQGSVDGSLGFDPTDVAPSKMTFAVGSDGFSASSTVTASDLLATPVSSDLSGFDAGDTVKFAIVIQNTGGQDAFDIVLRDTLPSGFAIPAGAILSVQYGDGSAVDFSGDLADLFGVGIEIEDDAGIGGISAGGSANGQDIIVLSYELVAVDDVAPGIEVENTAELVSYASIEGGTDFTDGVDGQLEDVVVLNAQDVSLSKRLIATDRDFTSGNDLTIGEIGTFQIEVTLPDGETPATVTDVLPTGLELVGSPVLRLTFTNADGDTVTFEGTVEQSGSPLADGAALGFTYAGDTLTFDFSNIVTDAAAGTDLAGQTFVIEYQARAADDPALAAGDTVSNSATLDTPTTDPTDPATAAVDIVEPDLRVVKTFQPETAEAGQIVQMRVSVQNASGASSTTSFGLELEDIDPDMTTAVFSDITLVSVTGTGGVATQLPGSVNVTVVNNAGQWEIALSADDDFAIAPGERLDLTFSLEIAPDVVSGTEVENTATILDDGYSSLPGEDPEERLYGPENGTDTLSIATPTITKTIVNTSYGGTEQLSPGDPGYQADTDTAVLVGEIVTYELRVRIPRGVSENVVVLDDTDFLNPDGAIGIMNIVGVDSVAIGGDLATASQVIDILDPDGDGVANRLAITFGEITNSAGGAVDVDAESIVVVFRAQLLNVAETNDGDVHTNATAVTFTTGETPDFNLADTFPTVTVREPDVSVVKTATPPDSTTDAGDVVTFTLVLSHTGSSTADAFALDLTDMLPDDLELVAGSASIVTPPPTFGLDPLEAGDVTLDIGNNRVLVSGFDLGLGQTVTISYQARVADDVVAGQVLTNEVELDYRSLPDEDPVDGVDPSVALAGTLAPDTNEGTTGASETRGYDTGTEETVTIAVPGPISKTADKASYTIGEQITYTILIPVIEGMTVDPFLTDVLPAGQDFIEGSGSLFAADGTPISATFSQVGQTLTLEGDTFITAADNDPDNDYIRVTFSVVVEDVAVNNNGDVKTNTVTAGSGDEVSRTATATVTVVEPDLILTKTNDASGPLDAGDVVTYTVTARHSAQSGADAYEFAFSDTLPDNLGPVGLISATVDGTDVSGQLIFDGTELTGTDIDIPLGTTFTLVYQLEVLDTVGPDQTIANTATASWTSLDGDVAGERTGIAGDPVDDYVTSATTSIETDAVLDLDKTILAADTEFAVGETVSYALDITVMEGTLQNVVVFDSVEAGLEIDLTSLQVVAGSFAGNAVSIVNPTLTTNAQGFSILRFELDNAPEAGSQIVNPGDPIGDTTNNDTIRITYNALVANVLSNQDGVELNNAAAVEADDVSIATGAEKLTVVEPELGVEKTLLAPADLVIDAGDTIQYQVVVTNTGTSTAYDVTFLDLLPDDTSITGAIAFVEVNASGSSFADTGSTVTGTIDEIAVGGTVTITYSVTVEDSFIPGEDLTNNVDVQWTSTAGDNPEERTGDDGPGPDDDTVLNNYDIEEELTISPNARAGGDLIVGKTLEATSLADTEGNDLTIGEIATFRLRIVVPEGTTQALTVVDNLPAGQRLVDGSLTIDFGNPAATSTLDPVATATIDADNVLTVTFGDVVNPGDNVVLNDYIDIFYQVVVENDLSNQDGTGLTNTVRVTNGAGDTATALSRVTVVEPDIGIDKSVITVTPGGGTIDAGDEIEYQVVLTNTGTADAYDIVLSDTAPANTAFTGVGSALDGSNNPVGTLTITSGSLSLTGLDIAVGETVTVTYWAEIAVTVEGGDVLTNDATVTWTSLPGTEADERTGADGEGPDAAVLDNYEASDTVTGVIGEFPLTVDKRIADTSQDFTDGPDVAVGEIVTFAIRVSVAEGTTRDFTLQDVLPDGLRFLTGTFELVAGDPAMTVTYGEGTAVGNVLTLPDITVINPGDADTTNDYFDVFYQVVVEDDAANVFSGGILSNDVTVTSSAGTEDTSRVDVTVVEPDLTIDKSVDAPFVAIGDTAQYTITVEHSGVSAIDAFDLVITDPFDDPNILLDQGSLTATLTGAPGADDPVIEFVGTGFRVSVSALPVGASLVIEFEAEAQTLAAANGATSVNTAALVYDTIPDADTPDEQRDYAASDDATVIIAGPDLEVIKEVSTGIIAPGEAFSYTIQVLNAGAPGVDAGSIEDATNVIMTDTLPTDVELLAVTVDGTPVGFAVDPDTTTFTVDLGTLTAGQTAIVELSVRLNDPLSPVTDPDADRLLLVNTASAFPDEPDPTPENNTDTANVVPLDNGSPPVPDLVVTKTNSVSETGGSELVTFTITAQNVGSRIAAEVQVIDQIDTRVFDFVSANGGGVYDAASGTVTWLMDTLSPDDGLQTYTMDLRVKPALPASIMQTTNIIAIADNGLGGDDPTPENNTDTHTDRLIYPNLVVTKTNFVDEISPGDILNYEITVSNAGEFQADGVRVVDLPDPSIYRFVSATDGGVYDAATGRITWDLGTVAPGDAAIVLSLTLEVKFPTTSVIGNGVNVVTVVSDRTRGLDSNPFNNVAFDIDLFTALPDPSEIDDVLGNFDEDEEDEDEEILFVAPILTGTAAPGATVSVVLYGPGGGPIHLGSVQSSSDGSWLMSLPNVAGRGPVSAIVTTSPPMLSGLGALDSTNVFLNPGGDSPIGFQRQYDIFNSEDASSAAVLTSKIAASEDPYAVGSRHYVNYGEVAGTSMTGG